MFTANSMNCLTEALGLALPGNGSVLATHAERKRLFVEAGHLIVDLARRYYEQDDASVLPRNIASFKRLRERDGPRHRHGRLDQHRAAPPRRRPRGRSAVHHGRHRPALAPGAGALQGRARHGRRTTWRTCTAPAASWRSWASSTAPACMHRDLPTVHAPTLGRSARSLGHLPHQQRKRAQLLQAAPGGVPTQVAFSQDRRFGRLDLDAPRLHPRRRARLLPTAGWPCCTAISPRTAAS